MNSNKILPIWDLCHYGYPDDLDPLSDEFIRRFTLYCRAAAEYVSARVPGPHFFTPINEITFFSYCGGLYGWIAPYRSSMKDSLELRKALCRADIAAVHAIREVLPEARMVHLDPIVQIVPPQDRPDLAAAAFYETYVDTFLAWDILAGKEFPEMGGAPEILTSWALTFMRWGKRSIARIICTSRSPVTTSASSPCTTY
jgi:beta-glucosidase/6-phospho-beta-glucosidase/beta-galactosidase